MCVLLFAIISTQNHIYLTLSILTTHCKSSAGGNCENLNVLSGHKNAILDVTFTNDSEKIITASADYNLGVYDAMTGERIKRFMGPPPSGAVAIVGFCITR